MSKKELQKKREKRYKEASQEIRSMDNDQRLDVYMNYNRLINMVKNLMIQGMKRSKPK